jgi:hypothetical protein
LIICINSKGAINKIAPFKWDTAMYDYIEISKQLYKDTANLIHLKERNKFPSGSTSYHIPGNKPLSLIHIPESNKITISGSIPYFLNGHNFSTNNKEFYQGFEYLEGLLQISLFNSVVEKFEYFQIVETPMKANTIIKNHLAPEGMDIHIYKNGRYFEDNLYKIKMYNPQKRIFQVANAETQMQAEGLGFDRNKQFTKFEVHYKKPYQVLNNGHNVILSDLLNPEFIHKIEDSYLQQYSRIMKPKSVKIPATKKELTTDKIILLALAESTGSTGQSVKEILYSFLKQIPDSILTKEDKKARQAQIRKLLKIIQEEDINKYDLTELLKEKMQYIN